MKIHVKFHDGITWEKLIKWMRETFSRDVKPYIYIYETFWLFYETFSWHSKPRAICKHLLQIFHYPSDSLIKKIFTCSTPSSCITNCRQNRAVDVLHKMLSQIKNQFESKLMKVKTYEELEACEKEEALKEMKTLIYLLNEVWSSSWFPGWPQLQ